MCQLSQITSGEMYCINIVAVEEVSPRALFSIEESLSKMMDISSVTQCLHFDSAVWKGLKESIVLEYWPVHKVAEGKQVNVSSPSHVRGNCYANCIAIG